MPEICHFASLKMNEFFGVYDTERVPQQPARKEEIGRRSEENSPARLDFIP